MKKRIRFILLIIIIVSIVFFINNTTSRYISETNLSGTITGARPYLSISASIPTQELEPNDYSTFEFDLRNFVQEEVGGVNVTHISEVPMTYYIEIINKTEKDNNALRHSKKLCRHLGRFF